LAGAAAGLAGAAAAAAECWLMVYLYVAAQVELESNV
jgi:hypothetical protein